MSYLGQFLNYMSKLLYNTKDLSARTQSNASATDIAATLHSQKRGTSRSPERKPTKWAPFFIDGDVYEVEIECIDKVSPCVHNVFINREPYQMFGDDICGLYLTANQQVPPHFLCYVSDNE